MFTKEITPIVVQVHQLQSKLSFMLTRQTEADKRIQDSETAIKRLQVMDARMAVLEAENTHLRKTATTLSRQMARFELREAEAAGYSRGCAAAARKRARVQSDDDEESDN